MCCGAVTAAAPITPMPASDTNISGGGANGAAQTPIQAPTAGGGAPATDVGGAAGAADQVAGGGDTAQPQTLAEILPALKQAVESLAVLVEQMQAQQQAQPTADVVGGGDTAGGAPSGCTCAGMQATAGAMGGGPDQAAPAADAAAGAMNAGNNHGAPTPSGGPAQVLDSPDLKIKKQAMTDKQRANLQAVLEVGVQMGANTKVLETAVSTVIQESGARNDSSVDSKDHDSLGLFQQRPSQGWGSRAEISDPRYAAKKFFEKAIPNDAKNPGYEKTRLAQSVQISAFPDAYKKWDSEAEAIVKDFLGG